MRGRDLTASLPDEVLQHVLSFLPSREAVQTSVLSPRWRDLWKSTPTVRVSGRGDGFRLFVNSLLHHRNDASPLRTFEIDDLVKGPQPSTNFFFDDDDDDDDEEDAPEIDPHPDVDLWLRHALSTCRASSLTARFDEEGFLPWRPRSPFSFTSNQLTTMHLEFVELVGGLLNFSPCPALLHLSLSGCRLNGDAIVSPSLERLSIIRCDIPIGRNTAGRTATMRISTPNLRHLQISDSCDGEQTAPSLDSMPLLTTASIRFTGSTQIYPTNGDASLLLHGLSEATSLELTASTPDGKAILQGDLRWCPTFTELKTLILNEWCLYDDVTALSCLLRHTPALESLQLDFKSSDTLQEKTKGSCIILKELFPTLENLKTVKIGGHCSCSDTKNHKILKLFSDWGIPRCKVKYALNYKAVDATMEGEKRRGGQEDGEIKPVSLGTRAPSI